MSDMRLIGKPWAWPIFGKHMEEAAQWAASATLSSLNAVRQCR
jgi:hypothetical protein